jgi:hypothetical protein
MHLNSLLLSLYKAASSSISSCVQRRDVV